MRLEIPYGDGYLTVDTGMRNSILHLDSRKAVSPPDLEYTVCNEIEKSGVLRNTETDSRYESDIVLIFDNLLQFSHPETIMNAVLSAISARAIPLSSLAILFVLPTYARRNLESVIRLLGDNRTKECQVYVHDENRKDTLQYHGDTPTNSYPVYLNSLYTKASLRIVVSNTRPNVFTGTTGSTTCIAPGLCGVQTTLRLQKLMVQYESQPYQINPILDRAISEVVDFCYPELAINVVQDNVGNIAKIVVGDLRSSCESAVNLSKDLTGIRINRRADIALVGAGGRGFDGTLYDALPSLYAGATATRTGGSILFVAECQHGPGPDGFVKGVASCDSEKDVEVMSETNFEFGMERARFFWRVLSSRNLIICSRLRDSLITEKLHAIAVRDPQEGLELAVKQLGTSSKIALIENGSNAIPIAS